MIRAIIVYAAIPEVGIAVYVGVRGDSCDREDLRKWIKTQTNATHVWFGDEEGSDKDPVAGPYPTVGSRAEALAN